MPAGGEKRAEGEALRIDIEDLQSAFDNLVAPAGSSSGGEGRLASDERTDRANAELFGDIAANYAGQVRDFMMELSVGESTKDWIDMVRPGLAAILKAAHTMDQAEIATALEAFAVALEAASAAPHPRIRGAERDRLLECYPELVKALPGAFELGTERQRREPVVVHHLLLQVPDVHKATIDRVYAAGVSSLAALCRTSGDELAQVAGIPRERAEAIAAHFSSYWQSRTRSSPVVAQQRVRDRLREVTARLDQAHEAFLQAERAEDSDEKRRARNARREQILEMNVLLAQMGEVDLVRELERCPVRTKIERLRAFIEQKSVEQRSGAELTA